jgi:hypothetical protein
LVQAIVICAQHLYELLSRAHLILNPKFALRYYVSCGSNFAHSIVIGWRQPLAGALLRAQLSLLLALALS